MNVKQILVIRKDLRMLSNRLRWEEGHNSAYADFSDEEVEWLTGSFTKITVQVDNEAELLDVYAKAKDAGLTAELITDAGRTEFGGVPTRTVCAIGPHEADKLAPITGHLKLY